jgi:hypothetical protein
VEEKDFNIPIKRDITDYSLHPRKPKLEPTRKIYGDDWRYPDNEYDE